MSAGLLLLLLVAGEDAASEAQVEALLARAAEARQRGDLDGSLALMEQAYRLAPAPELRNNVGFLQEQLGRYRDAAATYRAVIADPATDPALRTLDQQRLDQLAQKLDRAWVAVPPSLVGRVLLDGDRLGESGPEVGVAPERVHVLEVRDGPVARLFWRRFPAGVRTTIQPAELSGPIARINLDVPIDALTVDGYNLRTLDAQSVAVPPGFRRVTFRPSGRGAVDVRVEVSDAAPLSLAGAMGTTQAVVAVEPAPGPSILPPLAMGLGAAAAATGATLLILAESDRRRLNNLDRNDAGLITELTYPEAVSLSDRSRTRTTAGSAVLSVGGAILVGSLIWWLFD